MSVWPMSKKHDSFFATAGLDLGAETPEEIVLSIVSEVQRVFGTGCGESLRERKMSSHRSAPQINTALAAHPNLTALSSQV
jgi:hypothetical protein